MSLRKRKAVTRDSPEADEVALSDGEAGELAEALLNGFPEDADQASNDEVGSAGESSEFSAESEGGIFSDFDDEIDSDEIPSANEKGRGNSELDIEDLSDEDIKTGLSKNYKIVKAANGGTKYMYENIDPVYDSDDSEAPATTNTIGKIPLSFYDAYPHIGYDVNGKKVSRPAQGAVLDTLLDSIEVPKGWTGLTDPSTGKPLELSNEELEVLRKIQQNEVPEDGFDPYPATIEYFTSKTEKMPLSAAPEPKRRFVPSKHEAKRVMKIVKAIREGRIMPYKKTSEEQEEETDAKHYDLWANEKPRPEHSMHIAAPKLPPPGYEESYHPPPEYLPDEKETKEWEDADEEDREKDFLPTNHDSLRKVPGYSKLLKEKFDRCLDLYLAPRVRRSKLNIDPESLLPKLPDPDELRPFPTACAAVFRGSQGRVRSLAVDPSGTWLASGGDDGTVRVWELIPGRQVWSAKLDKEEAVNAVRWRPGVDAFVLSAATGETVYLMVPPVVYSELETKSHELLNAGYAHSATTQPSTTKPHKDSPSTTWSRPNARLQEQGILTTFTTRKAVKTISWHRRGEYFSTVAPHSSSTATAIHTLSKHLTQFPFRRLKGLTQSAHFHPSQPIFFVATKTSIRSYDLAKQQLLKVIQPGAKWISSFDVHPGGDNLIVGSYDKRLLWHDLELSNRPYKTLRYHRKAIRAVKFHASGALPLFADASDDGTVQVFHGKVVDDAMENASIVPLKVLRGHAVKRELGVLDLDWHPRQPWCVSAGADGTCRLWM